MSADKWLDDVLTLRALLRLVLDTRKASEDAVDDGSTVELADSLYERMKEAERMAYQFLSKTG